MDAKLANAQGIYIRGIRDGEPRRAMAEHTGDRYTQHSTGITDGPTGFIEFFEGFVERNPHREIRILRTIVDGSHVFLHVYQDLNRGKARWITMDLFDTDSNDKVIEHWDVIAAYTDQSANAHTQIDGWAASNNEGATGGPDLTEANKALVAEFMDEVIIGHRVDLIENYVSAESYIQHNPSLPDGIRPLTELLDGPARSVQYDPTFRLVGEGPLVAAYSRARHPDGDQAVFHLFRVSGGRIVEHWDNSEPIPSGPQPNSGKF